MEPSVRAINDFLVGHRLKDVRGDQPELPDVIPDRRRMLG
jgi:hypothetical protein